jgi:chlorobactene glucosyltransferase
LLLTYQLVILGILLVITAIAAVNLLTLRRFRDFRLSPRANWPLVSALVPARNEQRNIERCLRSLLAQDYPNLEVIVLDDDSEDGTAALVERLITEGDGRLRLLRGGPLAEGWLGKNNACRQLVGGARGDYLLFTDADTYHAPFAVSSALAIAEQQHADLVTTWPRQEVESWGERVALPLLHFTVIAYLPLALANGPSRNPAFGLGNGQFMFFRRAAYDAIGGHGAVRDRILEDVILARIIKAHGFRLVVADGSEALACRMYRSTAETWCGLAKTLYAFFFYSLVFAAFMLALQFLLFVAPYLFLLWTAFHSDLGGKAEWLLLPALQVGLMLVVRFALAARFREPLLDSLWQPISFLFYFGATIYAIWLRYARGEVTWKGRRYTKPN